MDELQLTKKQACRFILAHQSLWPPRDLEGKDGILQYISRVGCIQFDPLDVAGRSPELVLQARVRDFRPRMLEELLYEDWKLLDGWDKMMSIYSATDWPYFRRHRESALKKLGHPSRPVVSVLDQVREAVREKGPISSIDLDHEQTVDWPWGPTRIGRAALESMYFWGELIIHHRIRNRKVYDFADRHIPEELLSTPDPNETEEQYHDWRILRRIGGIGLVWNKSGDAWLGIPGIKAKERGESIKRLLNSGKLTEVHVEGLAPPFYLRSHDILNLRKVLVSEAPPPRAAILAPLDNLLWDRRLVKELFDFEYRWEVYKPAAERQYGYYVLPVLYGDRFIARFEPGRDKKNGGLLVKDWWWEPDVDPTDEKMLSDLSDCFRQFLRYLGTDQLKVAVKKRKDLEWLV